MPGGVVETVAGGGGDIFAKSSFHCEDSCIFGGIDINLPLEKG